MNDHYARGLGAADLATLDMDRTQLVQPGGGGGGSMAVREVIIAGYADSPRGGTSSIYRCREIDASGAPTGSEFDVFVYSYDGLPANWGKVTLSLAVPLPGVGARIPVYSGTFDGQARTIALFAVQGACA